MHRPLSAGVRQSVHFVNNGLQISLSAPVQKTTAHKVNVRRRRATGKLFDGARSLCAPSFFAHPRTGQPAVRCLQNERTVRPPRTGDQPTVRGRMATELVRYHFRRSAGGKAKRAWRKPGGTSTPQSAMGLGGGRQRLHPGARRAAMKQVYIYVRTAYARARHTPAHGVPCMWCTHRHYRRKSPHAHAVHAVRGSLSL